MPVPVSVRVTAVIVALLASAYAGVRLVNRWLSDPAAPVVNAPHTPPAAVSDQSNPGILIPGGVLGRGQVLDGAERGPRSTQGEGFRGTELDGFWIQQHEVTNAEFRRFDPEHQFPVGQERHPVVNVTWEAAMSYARWLGGYLPTEAQWEFAASGTEGRKYPWGGAEPTCEVAHFGGCGDRWAVEVMTHPAGSTPEGIHDLAGNVWEWVAPIWYEPGKTPVNQEVRRMRGGSFDDEAFFLRAANRSNGFRAGHRYISSGFRVVWPAAGG
ncbi:MAG: formylglycine-generating enzyme family protein [Gemmatimonadota bacterium]|nr:formylglycine-generating enzyme family protein [Gemmatimonadota bacterium]